MPTQRDSVDRKERELKFALATDDITKVKSLPLFATLRRSEQPLFSTYFDTADLALGSAGMSLRVRTSGSPSNSTGPIVERPRYSLLFRGFVSTKFGVSPLV